eukprot:TRINITY_DN41534_c0_g1_i3.p1 TRINITY_DN41534_c0_g1~~TRINITY_DN41534_c0_g1_i3.p1  ORF type:complete len:673 (-),score=118.60 TRINITY_DN41534_c0_g1_i3:1479-3497(-)
MGCGASVTETAAGRTENGPSAESAAGCQCDTASARQQAAGTGVQHVEQDAAFQQHSSSTSASAAEQVNTGCGAVHEPADEGSQRVPVRGRDSQRRVLQRIYANASSSAPCKPSGYVKPQDAVFGSEPHLLMHHAHIGRGRLTSGQDSGSENKCEEASASASSFATSASPADTSSSPVWLGHVPTSSDDAQSRTSALQTVQQTREGYGRTTEGIPAGQQHSTMGESFTGNAEAVSGRAGTLTQAEDVVEDERSREEEDVKRRGARSSQSRGGGRQRPPPPRKAGGNSGKRASEDAGGSCGACGITTADASLRQALSKGVIGVVKASYFESCLRRGTRMRDRRSIPASNFYTGSEIMERWTRYGLNFLIVVSYTWLTDQHPDPDAYHLERLVGILHLLNRRLLAACGEEGDTPDRHKGGVGVVLDYCCLPRRGGRDAKSSSSQYQQGLEQMRTLFSHPKVTAVKLVTTPLDQPRRYAERAQTLLETLLIDFKHLLYGSRLAPNRILIDDNFDAKEAAAAQSPAILDGFRRERLGPPLSMRRFEDTLTERRSKAEASGTRFVASEADLATISGLYQVAYEDLTSQSRLSFCDLGWGTDDLKEVCQCLPDCNALKELKLADNAIRDVRCLTCLVPEGLEALQLLDLTGNPLKPADEADLKTAWEEAEKDPTGLLLE